VSIILSTQDDRDLQINAWNWGVLHHVVANASLFSDEVWEPKRYNAGGDLDASQVIKLAEYLESRVLPCLRHGERMFFDGTTTDVPHDGTFYRHKENLWKNYSLHREVLVDSISFLRGPGGPVSFY
jgi:hypothetical protein